ncbi:hypothetical protein Hanom_Chr12g01085451 [Helianthus anomalus]
MHWRCGVIKSSSSIDRRCAVGGGGRRCAVGVGGRSRTAGGGIFGLKSCSLLASFGVVKSL